MWMLLSGSAHLSSWYCFSVVFVGLPSVCLSFFPSIASNSMTVVSGKCCIMQDNCVALLSLQSSICMYILATWRDVSMIGRSWIYCQVDEDRTQLQRKCLELVAAADQTHQQKLCTVSHRVNADPPSEDIEALQVTYHFLPRLQGLIMAFLLSRLPTQEQIWIHHWLIFKCSNPQR